MMGAKQAFFRTSKERLNESTPLSGKKTAPSDRTWLSVLRGNLLTVVLFLAQALFQALEPAFYRSLWDTAVPTSRGPSPI